MQHEKLFDTNPYEVENKQLSSALEPNRPVELLSQREVFSVCDELYDSGQTREALEVYEQWEEGADIRRARDGA